MNNDVSWLRDMLNGELNRIMISDDPEEIKTMYEAALKNVDTLYHACLDKIKK